MLYMQLDQFYTKDEVAKRCYDKFIEILTERKIDINNYDKILEPSAGRGAFYKLLPNEKRVGIDLEPKYEGLLRLNFFDYKPKEGISYIVLGNPPFGKISSLAIKFFNRSAEFSDIIAFIVPRTFKRISIQNKLALEFTLIYNEDLPTKPCCFEPKMMAKCCFQIWVKNENEKREKIVLPSKHDDFSFLKLGSKDEKNQPTPPKNADFVMKAYGANCGEIVCSGLQNLRPKSWHWIKSHIDIELLKSRFESLDYSISKDTARQDSIGQKEVIYLYSSSFN